MTAVRKYGTKLGGIIAITVLGMALLFFLILWLFENNLVNKEIHKVIEAQNGKVIAIQKIKLEASSFITTMESREGKRGQYSNTFYRITYLKDNKESIAWYRAVNGFFKITGETTDFYNRAIEEKLENIHLIKTYGDRWIFE